MCTFRQCAQRVSGTSHQTDSFVERPLPRPHAISMLIWRLRIPRNQEHKTDKKTASHTEVVCRVQKRDAVYRLMMRSDGAIVVDETFDSIFTAARRAEELRQQARPTASPAPGDTPSLSNPASHG